MDLEAVRDTLIVRVEYLKKIGNSTIIIPEGHGIKDNHMDFVGHVLSVGPDVTLEVKSGDKIVFTRNEGHKITTVNGENIISLSQKWVEGKVCEEI